MEIGSNGYSWNITRNGIEEFVIAALIETAFKRSQDGFLCRYHPYISDIYRHKNVVIAPLYRNNTQLDTFINFSVSKWQTIIQTL